jgi:hypothetical protein
MKFCQYFSRGQTCDFEKDAERAVIGRAFDRNFDMNKGACGIGAEFVFSGIGTQQKKPIA